MTALKFYLAAIFVTVMVGKSTGQEKKEWINYPKTVSLTFSDDDHKDFKIGVEVNSYIPLKTDAKNLTVLMVKSEAGQSFEGFTLSDMLAKGGKTPFYIFNSATQCFVYGYIVTTNGQSYWSAGTALEQVTHNICAPRGEMYCKQKT